MSRMMCCRSCLAFPLVVVLTAAAGGASAGARIEAAHVSQAAFRDGAVLVSFSSQATEATRASDEKVVSGRVEHVYRTGVELLSVPKGHVGDAVSTLLARKEVRYAEPDYIGSESATPDDSSFNNQWALANTGQTVNGVAGTPGADEHAVPAWGVTTGSRSIVVGEVDSGVDYNHPDLAANVWTNPGGIAGCAAGTHGYDVLSSTCDPMDLEQPYGGHGTHVAGIIGAVGNNGIGVAGVNWVTSILPVKWLNTAGSGSTSDLLRALDWVLQAQQAGVNVRIVNDSVTFVGTAYSQAVSDEIDLLGQHNILFVTPAGNTADDNDDLRVRRYPCGYDRPTEICVAASNQSDTLPVWANYGARTVDLAAPGDNIYSTLRNGTFGYINGSSMAAAEVSGAAALVLSTTSLSTAQLKAAILDNVDAIPALAGKVRTGGRLDVCKAIPACGSPTAVALTEVTASRRVGSVVVRWRAESKATTLGYNVFREVAGKRVRVNSHLVPTATKAGLHFYTYADHAASSGTARYWLQQVATNGSRTWRGPISVR